MAGFTGGDFAYFGAAKNTLVTLFILFILPWIKFHPSSYCVFALTLQSIMFFILPHLTQLWTYFVANILMLPYLSAWASARTLFTFCVDENDGCTAGDDIVAPEHLYGL